MDIDIAALSQKFFTLSLEYAPKIIGAIAVLIIGFWLAKRILGLFQKLLDSSGISLELNRFMRSAANIILRFVVILFAASILGFEVSSLLGVLAGLVFAIGLALQGFLGNFASGIIIVFFKPYKVGDWVKIDEYFGKVEDIQIFYTILNSPSNKTLVIPNGQVSDHVIVNYSQQGKIRLELNVLMPYSESFPKVQQVIFDALKSVPNVIQSPEPLVGIETFDSHNIIVSARPYIDPDHFWDATFDAMAAIKKAMHEAGIEMAYSEGVELGKIGG